MREEEPVAMKLVMLRIWHSVFATNTRFSAQDSADSFPESAKALERSAVKACRITTFHRHDPGSGHAMSDKVSMKSTAGAGGGRRVARHTAQAGEDTQRTNDYVTWPWCAHRNLEMADNGARGASPMMGGGGDVGGGAGVALGVLPLPCA